MAFERLLFPRGYARHAGTAPCALDSIAALDATLLPAHAASAGAFPIGCTVRFDGWAVVPVLGGYSNARAVLLHVGDTKTYLPATVGIARDDVARNLADITLNGAGFRGIRPLDASVPLGRHRLSLAVVSETGQYFESQLDREIDVVASAQLFPNLPVSDRTAVAGPEIEAMHGAGTSAKAHFERGSILVARGEAVDRDAAHGASRVFAIVDGTEYFGGIAGLTNERGERNAYCVRVPTRHLRPGAHVLRIAAVANDGTSYSLGETYDFVLRGA